MSRQLKMSVRMSIIPEISKQNYDTIAKQFREVIANSYDANATLVNINIRNTGFGDNRTTDIIFIDNGDGMTQKEFKEDYLGVGGSWKENNDVTIGRIGIGSLAIAVIAKTVRIETRKKGQNEVIVAELRIADALRGVGRKTEVQDVTIGEILDIRSPEETEEEHFTKIILHEVDESTAKILNDKERFYKIIYELRKILPLKYPEDHPLMNKLDADLREVLLDKNRLGTIDVFISAPCIGSGSLCLERYAYGDVDKEDESISGYPHGIRPITVQGGANPDLTIYGYLIDAGKQLKDNGIVVRVKNMGVELNCLFESSDAPANMRIVGELFVENLDSKAMTINRNELIKEHPDYISIQKIMEAELGDFRKEVRKRVNVNSTISKKIEQIKGVRDAFKKVAEGLSDIDTSYATKPEECSFGSLDKKESINFVNEIREIDSSIVVYEVAALKSDHDIQHIDDEIEVTISRDLLENNILIGDTEYSYFLKNGDENEPVCEIDFVDNKIYLNVNNPILKSRGHQIVKAVIALTFAYFSSNNDAEKLYNLTLQILANSFK